MALSRFDKFLPKQFDWQTLPTQLPQLNFELLDQMLGQQQNQLEQSKLISQKVPNALQTEDDLAKQQQYKQMVEQGLDSVTQAYAKDGIQAGNRAYRDYVNNIKQQWQPSGLASILESRYQGYQQGRKAIDDYYKDETNPVFKQYAYDQLSQQVQKGTGYDPSTGRYNQVATPELFKNPNLRKAVLESIKEIDESGTTQFLRDLNKDWWIPKIKTTGRPEDKVRLMNEALMQQPEFANELKVEGWYQNRDGRGQQRTEQYIQDQKNQLSNLEGLHADAEKGKGTKDWQTFLAQQGYDIQPDGKFGETTKKAGQDYLDKQKGILEQNLSNPELSNLVSQKALQKTYVDYALGFVDKKVEKDLVFNKAKDAMLNASVQRARTQALISGFDSLKPTPNSNVLVTPTTGVNLETSFSQLKANQETTKQFEQQLNDGLTKNKNSVFYGWTPSNVAEAQRLFDSIPNNVTGEERKARFKQLLANNSDYKFNPQQSEDIFNAVQTNPNIKQGFEELQKMKENEQMLKDYNAEIAGQYVDTPEGKKALVMLNDFRQPGETDAQLAARALANPKDFTRDSKDTKWHSGVRFTEETLPNMEWANEFAERMKSDVKKQQKNGMQYKTQNGYVVSFGNQDDFMKPSIDMLNSAITNQSTFDFKSEGKAGLIFRNDDGSEYEGNQRPVITDSRIANGKLVATGWIGTGDKKKKVTSVIDLDPGNPMTYEIKEGLEKTLAYSRQVGSEHDEEGLTRNLLFLNGYDWSKAATQQSAAYNKAQPQAIQIKRPDGKITTTSSLGFNTELVKTEQYQDGEGNLRRYHTYVAKTKSGETKFLNVADVYDREGNVIGQQVIPDRKGNQVYSTVSGIDIFNTANSVISRTPVEATRTKVPVGQQINETQLGTLLQLEGNE